jgi:hypothetical protein
MFGVRAAQALIGLTGVKARQAKQSRKLSKFAIGMGASTMKRNRLTPWIAGAVMIVAAVLYVGYRMWVTNCAPLGIELGVLTVIPVIYLVLMYLTFVSQK